jgi:hypothetical protein
MSEWPPNADKEDIYELKKRLDNAEIAIGLILAELSKQIDTEKALDGALHRAGDSLYPDQITQILEHIKLSVKTALNR